MSAKIFPTAQDAENAFYEALERADLDLMMAVWAEDEDIVCVHPGAPRLTGVEQVRAAWRGMFASGPHLRIRPVQQVVISGMMVAVHNVHESITVQGEAKPRPAVVATNVYLRSAAGWRMVVHHASPPATGAAAAEPAPASSKTLH
ncbi:MAG: nuclear transport factor 2 family protein [Betaproteobacteria bacterium]|nr:nuclear transport factor 2 family protein [Betaproteobacteria bacterium]